MFNLSYLKEVAIRWSRVSLWGNETDSEVNSLLLFHHPQKVCYKRIIHKFHCLCTQEFVSCVSDALASCFIEVRNGLRHIPAVPNWLGLFIRQVPTRDWMRGKQPPCCQLKNFYVIEIKCRTLNTPSSLSFHSFTCKKRGEMKCKSHIKVIKDVFITHTQVLRKRACRALVTFIFSKHWHVSECVHPPSSRLHFWDL